MTVKGLFSVAFVVACVIAIIMVLGGCGGMSGCNAVTRGWGGSSTKSLNKGEKLVNLTWKEDSLWILTRQAKDGERPETYEFKEHSNFRILQGKITIKEQ